MLWHRPYDYHWDGRHVEAERLGLTQPGRALQKQIVLIRHGQYNDKVEDDAERVLSPKGHAQAVATGKALQALFLGKSPLFLAASPSDIIHSDLRRAAQTATEIRPYFPLVPMNVEPLLQEGCPCAPEPATWPAVAQMPLEERDADARRIEAAFQKYAARPLRVEETGTRILVCHGNVIRYFVCRALQCPPEAWLRMSVAHCSVTRIRISSTGRVSVEGVGDVGHLPAELQTFS